MEFKFTSIRQVAKKKTSTGTKTTSSGTSTARPNETVKSKTYTVVKGDCLWKIAKKYYGKGTEYNKIAKANNIKAPYLIYPGDVLKIP